MKTLVVYDSNFGNTEKVARTIAQELEAQAISVSEVSTNELERIELLIVGSPIHGWRPSPRMNGFLAKLEKGQLEGIKAATFDTRVKLFIHGDAAKKIAHALKDAGAEIIAEPQPFYVRGKERPLFDGEIEKALTFAKEIHLHTNS